jgi:hypothetical protein
MYLVCNSHTPELHSSEVGQHTYDLPDIQQYLAHRKELVRLVEADIQIGGSQNPPWAYTAAWFFAAHPDCEIGIIDEYGKTYPTAKEVPEGVKCDWVEVVMDVRIKPGRRAPTEGQWLRAARILGAEGFTHSTGSHRMKIFNKDG